MQAVIRFLKDHSGASAVEFAIVGNIFVMLVVGVLAVGYVFVVKADLEGSITAAERYAMIHEEDDATLKDIIRSKLATYDGSAISLKVSRATSGGVDYVRTDISYVVDLGVSFVFGPVSITTSRVFPT